jgi:hypothetical protein
LLSTIGATRGLKAQLKEQASQIQNVSGQLQLSTPKPNLVLKDECVPGLYNKLASLPGLTLNEAENEP